MFHIFSTDIKDLKGERKLYQFRNSEARVLEFIRRNPLVSRAQIALEIGMSKPMVSEAVQKLAELGVVKEIRKGSSSSKGGKKPILLSFNPEYRQVVGIDIGGTKVKVVVTNLNGDVSFERTFSSKAVRSKEDFYNLISNIIKSLNLEPNKILGIGIGVPGTVDSRNGFVSYMPAFELRNLPLKEDLQKMIEIPIFVGNDVTLNALGEMWKGAAKGHKNVLMISLGTGTGAGMIINGNLYEGSNGMAGEIGYMITDWSKENSHDLPFGRLERWFSGYSFEKILEKNSSKITVKDFFELSDSDLNFSKILDEACEHLALAISNAICLLNPDIVVIGGGIGYNQYERIIKRILPVLKNVTPREILEGLFFKKASLADLGVCLGAIYMVQKNTFII